MGLLNKIYSILDSMDFSIDNGEINIYFKIAKEYNIYKNQEKINS